MMVLENKIVEIINERGLAEGTLICNTEFIV